MNKNIQKLKALLQEAQKSGASEAKIISTKDIVVDDRFADMCREPRCENYGLSKSCPPHVSGPTVFKQKLEKFSQAVFFKIDVPSELLYSNERREVFRLLHEIAADIETSAVKMGFVQAQAYAGGSCKKIFCHDHSDCLALSEKGKCRNPQYAKPSMSGYGIDVAKLFKTAGWKMNWTAHGTDSTSIQMANVSGLVLIC